jgi:hypothetical protein
MDKKTISVSFRLGEENFQEYQRILETERAEFLKRNPDHEAPNDSRIVRSLFHRLAVAQGQQGKKLSYNAKQRRAS